MVQQKRDEIQFHQAAADSALALFNQLHYSKSADIVLNITCLEFSDSARVEKHGIYQLSINGKTKKAFLAYLQKVCEFHMVEKQLLISGAGSSDSVPVLPDWFTKYFTFCSELKINPLAADCPVFSIDYSIVTKKNGALIIQFDKPVRYRETVGNVWRASHGGTFEKL
jgi:hypothetical protein